MAKVFVVQEDPNKNLQPATRFGELVTLLPYKQIITNSKEYIEAVRKRLSDFYFDGDTDFVLLIGDPVAIAIVSAVISESWESFKVLKWDKQRIEYIPITLELT